MLQWKYQKTKYFKTETKFSTPSSESTENIQRKPVIVPSDLAKIRASPFLSLVLHSCKVRTEWPPTFRCRPQPQAFRVAFLTPVIFRETSRCFSAYRAALMTKSDLIFCGILFQICWLRSFNSAFKAIVSSRTSEARFKFDSGVILWTNHNSNAFDLFF